MKASKQNPKITNNNLSFRSPDFFNNSLSCSSHRIWADWL